jgi:hypothetical protein
MLLKAKTLIERVMKEETDHANKVNLESAILDLQIALGQKPRTKDVNISGQDTNIQIALLQKQVTDIEANMAKKMNQVIEVISQKKTPTYAEIASKNLPIPQVVITKKPASQPTSQAGNPTTVQEKPAEKSREKSAYREKRPILQTSKNFIKNLDAIQIRDQVNDAFFKKKRRNATNYYNNHQIAIQSIYSNHYYAKLLSKIPGRKEGGLEGHHSTPKGIY